MWFLVTFLGYGAQSLANFIELPIIAAVAVVLAYLKIFVADRLWPDRARNSRIAVVVVAALCVVLRTFMPSLPE
ncbi:MAG TPA: hypothetical protein VF188_11120 [Longimicrobiales bacterium]